MRIEITGPIGSGKSSLAKLLLDNGYKIVFEEFKANPFWEAFYSNPNKYNFETEITFILQHYHDLKRKLEETKDVVCDFSFTQDLGYAVMGLKKAQLDIFKSIHEYIIDELGEPTLIIFMKCSPEGLLERIRQRGRKEESLIDADFLISLSSFVKKQIDLKKKSKRQVHYLEIDTEEINIIKNPSDQELILRKISEII